MLRQCIDDAGVELHVEAAFEAPHRRAFHDRYGRVDAETLDRALREPCGDKEHAATIPVSPELRECQSSAIGVQRSAALNIAVRTRPTEYGFPNNRSVSLPCPHTTTTSAETSPRASSLSRIRVATVSASSSVRTASCTRTA